MISIYDGGSLYNVISVKIEHNRYFRWLKITAKWSGLGLRPLWANEVNTFLRCRKPIHIWGNQNGNQTDI